MYISKSDFLRFQNCPKDFWLSKKKPEVMSDAELSDFEQRIIEQGYEVESWAQRLFPDGIAVESAGIMAADDTKEFLDGGKKQIFQATFLVDGLLAMVDILEWDGQKKFWIINEVKGTTSQEVKKEEHLNDATFQKIVLEKAGLNIGRINLIELNKEFNKDRDIAPTQLLQSTDISADVSELEEPVLIQIDSAKALLSKDEEPRVCNCIYKSRKNFCPSFSYSHPEVPEYSVHDIVRIGSSKKRLAEMVDNDWLKIEDIPLDYKLSQTQTNQVHATITGNTIIEADKIRTELEKMIFPLYFLDYETFPTAIPVFDGCYPFQQVPFQYSLHVMESPGSELVHKEFLQRTFENPMPSLAQQLQEDIGDLGSVVVWNKKFEGKCNEDLAECVPGLSSFLLGINQRFFDLMEIFSKQLYVHKDFKGSSSIKYVLPVLVPGFTYENLDIQDGGMALTHWKKMIFDESDPDKKIEIANNLLEYCHLDTLAMVKIYEALSVL